MSTVAQSKCCRGLRRRRRRRSRREELGYQWPALRARTSICLLFYRNLSRIVGTEYIPNGNKVTDQQHNIGKSLLDRKG